MSLLLLLVVVVDQLLAVGGPAGSAVPNAHRRAFSPSPQSNLLTRCGPFLMFVVATAGVSQWLVKIAEVNPDFKVINFQDNSCSRVYIHSVL